MIPTVLAAVAACSGVTAASHGSQASEAQPPQGAVRLVADRGGLDRAGLDRAGLDRAGVIADFYDKAIANEAVPLGWTGDADSCVAGSVSAAAQEATLDQVNYYRSFYGLAPVAFDPVASSQAQEAALMMEANNDLSHAPPSTWRCYTAVGATAAGQSNISLGFAGAEAVSAYMFDDGDGNEAVGHRRWILSPGTTTMGSGSTDEANALMVVGGAWAPVVPRPEWMPYPPAGYFPGPLQPAGRWSLSTSESNTDFSAATVTMSGPQGPVPVSLNTPAKGYGPDTLVWEAGQLSWPTVGRDVTYTVSVSGVTRRGVGLPPYSYAVTLVQPDRSVAVSVKPVIKGTARVGRRLRVTAGRFEPSAPTLRFQWLRGNKPIRTARGTSYVVSAADRGKRLRVRLRAGADYYQTLTLLTARTSRVT